MRKGRVMYSGELAGWVWQDDTGYHFQYAEAYLADSRARDISLTLPRRKEAYTSRTLHAFFDGLIPEGWLLDLATTYWKLNPRDRMGLLLSLCRDTIGAVTVEEALKANHND